MNNQTLNITCIQKNGENICIMIPIGQNRSLEVLEYNKKVFNYFNIPVNYVKFPFPNISHGWALDYFLQTTLNLPIDYYVFFEQDSIPLKKEFIS